ncbi:unnamed protein product [Meganyctiphanes norvegica]|uniref:Uncharacterized protein n=1 Tax=Meganyctiphanes norvegica TaxID=48144 RepID=A0AAV2RP80_MEGNR
MIPADNTIDISICTSLGQLWMLSCLQEALEVIVRNHLLPQFHSIYQCRPGVTDTLFCHVRDVATTLVLKFPLSECVYDPWCGRVVLSASRAPLITRTMVLWAALGVSIAVLWAPRLFIYRPKNGLTKWIKRNTPRRILTMVMFAAILQIFLDHCVQPLILQDTNVLSSGATFCSFILAVFISTVILLFLSLRSTNKRLHTYTLPERNSNTASEMAQEMENLTIIPVL